MNTATINDNATKVAQALDLTFTTASKFCEACEDIGLNIEVAVAFWDHHGFYGVDLEDMEDIAQTAQDSFEGEHKDVEAYAWEYIESTGMLQGVPEIIARYFDAEAFGRDMVLGGDVFVVEVGYGRCFVFNNHN